MNPIVENNLIDNLSYNVSKQSFNVDMSLILSNEKICLKALFIYPSFAIELEKKLPFVQFKKRLLKSNAQLHENGFSQLSNQAQKDPDIILYSLISDNLKNNLVSQLPLDTLNSFSFQKKLFTVSPHLYLTLTIDKKLNSLDIIEIFKNLKSKSPDDYHNPFDKKDVFSTLLKQYPDIFNNSEYVNQLLQNIPPSLSVSYIKHINRDLLHNLELVKLALPKYPSLISLVPPSTREKISDIKNELSHYLPSSVRHSKDLALKLAKENVFFLKHLPFELQCDLDVQKNLIGYFQKQHKGHVELIEYIQNFKDFHSLKSHFELSDFQIFEAMAKFFIFMPPSLKSNLEFISSDESQALLTKQTGSLLCWPYLSPELKSNKTLFQKALFKSNGKQPNQSFLNPYLDLIMKEGDLNLIQNSEDLFEALYSFKKKSNQPDNIGVYSMLFVSSYFHKILLNDDVYKLYDSYMNNISQENNASNSATVLSFLDYALVEYERKKMYDSLKDENYTVIPKSKSLKF